LEEDGVSPALLRKIKAFPDHHPLPAGLEGRVKTPDQVLDQVRNDLKALDPILEENQGDHGEAMAIKPMFLNEDYR